MATLHIEHPISDLRIWLGAFSRFTEARKSAGVKAQRVHQPVDDDHYICVELDFDTVEKAQAFKRFLETNVWSSVDASPGTGRHAEGARAQARGDRRLSERRGRS